MKIHELEKKLDLYSKDELIILLKTAIQELVDCYCEDDTYTIFCDLLDKLEIEEK